MTSSGETASSPRTWGSTGRRPSVTTRATPADSQVTELHYDDARFYFFGFDKDIRRNAKQLIEVRKGDNSESVSPSFAG